MSQRQRSRRPGDRLGDWVIDEVLTYTEPLLYAAHNANVVDKTVVLKVAPWDKATAALHRRELFALRTLSHNTIPTRVDAGVEAEDGLRWCAFEPFRAESLADQLLRGPLDHRTACRVLSRVADALTHLHERDLQFRDLTPMNVFITDHESVVLFGMDHVMDPADAERSGDLGGSVSYMAPEVLADRQGHGTAAEVYAFGCLLYEALTARAPFPAATWGRQSSRVQRALQWKTRARPLDPGDGTPDWLRDLIRKCTHPDPERRITDAFVVREWLESNRSDWQSEQEPTDSVPFVPVANLPPLRVQPEAFLAAIPTAGAGAPPISVLYVSAAAMGCVAGLAFSAVVMLAIDTAGG